jgi:predicted Zn finger-like uncharacterized protein
MIIRCDSCSVSLQLDESKIPSGNFTVRCPRCQNLIRVTPNAKNASPVEQLKENAPAPAVGKDRQEFTAKENEVQINSALRSLLAALQTENKFWTQPTKQGKNSAACCCVSEKTAMRLPRL